MNNKINEKTFNKLASYNSSPCVSIYIPTHKAGMEVNEGLDIIAFKNKLQEAERQLSTYLSSPGEIKSFLKPAYKLLNDKTFWTHQLEGLSVFIGKNFFEYFTLPVSVEDFLLVGNSLHIAPLIPIAKDDTKFFILSLSQNSVRLFSATHFKISAIDIQGTVVSSLKEALKWDDPEKELQFVSGGNTGTGALFFGNDNGKELRKDDVRRFCQIVDNGNGRKFDKGILEYISSTNAPLVVAAVEYVHSIYKEITHYHNMMPTGIIGNPEMLSAEELHSKAWHIVEPYFKQSMLQADQDFGDMLKTDRTSLDIEQIVKGSLYSKVDRLFLVSNSHVWGYYDTKTNKIHMHNSYQSGDEDLLNTAAVNTVLNGGQVYYVDQTEMPLVTGNAAAIFRYPGKI